MYASRNDSLGFAARTRENLEFVLDASSRGQHVHAVTQLVNSMLGLVCFPWEALVLDQAKQLPFETLPQDGWPKFVVTLGKCNTLHDLLRHLRNAVAHGHMTYSSDSLNPNEVEIRFEDRPNKHSPVNWVASLRADDLKEFCHRFSKFVDDTIG
jgi:hypothetical protein